jgi:hypothetical protein
MYIAYYQRLISTGRRSVGLSIASSSDETAAKLSELAAARIN